MKYQRVFNETNIKKQESKVVTTFLTIKSSIKIQQFLSCVKHDKNQCELILVSLMIHIVNSLLILYTSDLPSPNGYTVTDIFDRVLML